MKDYLNLWVQFFQGLLALILAIFLPFIWLALELLPWGVTALITGNRLRPGYKYLYFFPRFIKELTRPLRNQETEIVSFFIFYRRNSVWTFRLFIFRLPLQVNQFQ